MTDKESDALDWFVERMSDNAPVVIIGMPEEETPLDEAQVSSGYNVDQSADVDVEGVTVETELADETFHLPGKHNQKSHGGGGPSKPKVERQYIPGSKKRQYGIEFAVDGPSITGGDGYDVTTMAANGTPWEGVLAVEGIETGDGRKFVENALTWMDEPMALRWNTTESHGGVATTTTVSVGRINEVWRDPERPNYIMGRGVFDDQGESGREALRRVREGFLSGISIDPDSIKDADVELVFPESDGESEDDLLEMMFAAPELTVFHAGRIRAATLVDIPAFPEAKIWLSDSATPAQTAVAASNDLHFSELSDRTWNGPLQEARLRGRMTVREARSAFAYIAAGTSPTTASARFLHHEVDDGGSVGYANLTACGAGIRAINAGRAQALSETERRTSYEHMAQHLRAAGIVPPPYEGGEVITASAGFEHLERPPREWFEDPALGAVTPLTITDDGRVFGHGAAWGTCHTAFPDACVTPPAEGQHAYYRLGEVVTADGGRVAVGHITLGTGHAPLRSITSSQAAEHYDNTGTVVAIVASGEDDHGIWVAGAVRPGVSESRVQELRESSLSGDWRRIGGQLRLVAFLAVNRPGFPIPRTQTFLSKTRQQSLVAAGIVTQDMRHVSRDDAGATRALMRIAKSIGRDPESRMAELRRRVRGE